MSTIISTVGFMKPVLIIVLNDLQDNGEVKHLEYEMNNTSDYQFQVYNPCDGMLYTVNGKLRTFGSIDPNNPYNIDWICIDTSTENHSKLTRINVQNIKSIVKMDNFE